MVNLDRIIIFRYALANLLLIIGAKKEIKLLVLLWIVFTVGFLIW